MAESCVDHHHTGGTCENCHLESLQVWGAMLFVEQCELWQREGGAVSHVMAGMMKLVLDNHRHQHTRPAHKRALSGPLQAPEGKEACLDVLHIPA